MYLLSPPLHSSLSRELELCEFHVFEVWIPQAFIQSLNYSELQPILKFSMVWVSVKWDIKVKVVLNKGESMNTGIILKTRGFVG